MLCAKSLRCDCPSSMNKAVSWRLFSVRIFIIFFSGSRLKNSLEVLHKPFTQFLAVYSTPQILVDCDAFGEGGDTFFFFLYFDFQFKQNVPFVQIKLLFIRAGMIYMV